jgi:hypothetical protein
MKLCPFNSDMDNGQLVDGSCMDIMGDTAIMLADVAMYYFGNNMSLARHWLLGDFTRLLTMQTSDPLDTVSLVRLGAVRWCFPIEVSNYLCNNGITERLTEEATQDAMEMHTNVKRVMDTFSPASPPPRSGFMSPTLGDMMLASPKFTTLDELLT